MTDSPSRLKAVVMGWNYKAYVKIADVDSGRLLTVPAQTGFPVESVNPKSDETVSRGWMG